MEEITAQPTGWVRIFETTPGPAQYRRDCALIPLDDIETELAREGSIATEVGDVEVGNEYFHDGLTDPFDGHAEFFCQIRWSEPFEEPSIEWSLPFLWYWRAVPQGNSWVYRDAAGRDIELARIRTEEPDHYAIEVQAMALRHYLHRKHMALLINVTLDDDHLDAGVIDREEYPLVCDWASMEFLVYTYDADRYTSEIAATSLHGQYVVLPAVNASGPSWCSKEEPEHYPDFVYAIDPSSGRELTVQPTRENAGTDGYPGPHFWKRIFFRPEVLDRYLAEPRRYTVSSSHIFCLPQWSLSIGRTSDRLVEVDLYDLSRMPWREWSHWKSHNVPPSGGAVDEGKMRREILNQPASSPDVVLELRIALERANDASRHAMGFPIWRELNEPAASEWNALHAPVVNDRAALQAPLLTLTTALVDGIDSSQLRKSLTHAPPPNTRSLSLLQQYLEQRGGDTATIQPLKDVQELRSQGGYAHYSGSRANTVLARIAGDAQTPEEIFTQICAHLVQMLEAITETLSETD